MNLKKELGNKIQALRKEKKITQEHFAEIVGIEPKSVSRIENGYNYPTPETLCAIANALGVEVYELFVFGATLSYDEMKKEIIKSLDDKNNIVFLYKTLKRY